jgi:DNA ligase (NAD+)
VSRIAKQIADLREQVRHHDRLYYLEAKPEISDLEYDRLLEQLRDLETAHPDLLTPDSPTQRVGGEPVSALTAVEHQLPMLSIDNTYSTADLKAWGKRTEKLLREAGNTAPIGWVLELKIDGVAVSLTYEAGRLVLGTTRGNGLIGDDITHNVRTIPAIPLTLELATPPPRVEVRGEIFMTNSALVTLNEAQATRGCRRLPIPAMSRPVAFGCLILANVAAGRSGFFAMGSETPARSHSTHNQNSMPGPEKPVCRWHREHSCLTHSTPSLTQAPS